MASRIFLERVAMGRCQLVVVQVGLVPVEQVSVVAIRDFARALGGVAASHGADRAQAPYWEGRHHKLDIEYHCLLLELEQNVACMGVLSLPPGEGHQP